MTAPPAASRPAFLWDPRRLRLIWANVDGLAFWGEDSVAELRERVFAPEDETARAFAARVAELEEGRDGDGGMSLRPCAEPVWVRAQCELSRDEAGGALLRVTLSQPGLIPGRLEALTKAGFDAAPHPLAVFAEDGRLMARNEADRRVFFPGPGDLFSRYVDKEEGRRALRAALASGGFSRKSETNASAGLSRHRISLRRMSDPEAGGLAVIAEFQEVLGQPPAGEQDAGGIARIAHDLRSPLHAIEGFAELIAMSGEKMSAERRAACLEDIRTASRRMLAMVERIVSKNHGAARFDLSALAAEVVRLHEPLAEAAGVNLTCCAEGRADIGGDETSAHRIIGNLLSNALEHGARRGGSVKVSVRRSGVGALIEVADDGPGMDPAQTEAALRAFGSAGEKRGDGRTGGLGLSGARELAEAMGARFEVKTAPGAGFAATVIFSGE